jgi:hypothetical protein
MKRLLLVAWIACMVGVPTAYAQTPPHVWIGGTAPLVVRGSGFKPKESVDIVAFLAQGTRRQTLRAAPDGSFSARFHTAASGCAIRQIKARGFLGTHASWTVPSRSCGTKAVYN